MGLLHMVHDKLLQPVAHIKYEYVSKASLAFLLEFRFFTNLKELFA